MITPQLDLGLSPEPLAKRAGATAGYKDNGGFGFKPMISYADGTREFPVAMHCRSPEAAQAIARAWIKAGRV